MHSCEPYNCGFSVLIDDVGTTSGLDSLNVSNWCQDLISGEVHKGGMFDGDHYRASSVPSKLKVVIYKQATHFMMTWCCSGF